MYGSGNGSGSSLTVGTYIQKRNVAFFGYNFACFGIDCLEEDG